MSATDGPVPFRYREEVHSVPDFALARMRFDGRMVGDNVITDRVIVVRPLSGRFEWEVGGRRGAAPGLLLLQPGDRISAGWGPLEDVMLDLDLAALRRTATLLYGTGVVPVRFDGPFTTDARFEDSIAKLIDVAQTIAAGPAFDNAIVRSSLHRSLAAAVLDGFALVGDREARRDSVGGLAVIHRRATVYMDDHASLPISIEDVVEEVGVPLTELERAFAVVGSTTPSAYLGWVRMSAANSDLQRSAGSAAAAGAPSATRPSDLVKEIALRWGFARPGRFARLYRKQYGVGPEDVLGS